MKKLTQTKADELTKILDADHDRAKSLLSLNANEAVVEINKLGYDFTSAEIREYGEGLKNAVELNDTALTGVAGGVIDAVDEDALFSITIGTIIIAPKAKTVVAAVAGAVAGRLFGQ